MNITPYLIINGKSSREISGLLIQSLAPISKPPQRTRIETIDGRDGDLVTELGFNAYDKPVLIGLTYNYNVDEVIEFFNSSGTVIFSNEPDKVYSFAIYNQIDFERLIRFKTATVVFHVQPYKYANNENPLNFAITSGVPVSITNNGNTDSKPDLLITGEGIVDLDINGEQILNIDFGEDEQTYIIDSDAMNAYATENAIKDVKMDFLAYQAEGTPTPSAPLPILGYDKLAIYSGGKNLIDLSSMVFGYVTGTGTLVTTHTQGEMRSGFIPVRPNTTYTFAIKETSSSYPSWCGIGLYKNDNVSSFIVRRTNLLTFTTTADTRFIVVSARNIEDASQIQLELGNISTDYKPYSGKITIIDFGGTYYGGKLDTKTGKLTLTHGGLKLSDAHLGWSSANNCFAVNKGVVNAKTGTSAILKCSCYKYASTDTNDLTIWQTNNGIRLRDDNYAGNLTAFLAAVGNEIMFFELATPVVIDLPPVDILSGLGVNIIFSDAGDVEVSYKAGGVIHTETGEIVIFTLTPEDFERGAFVNRQIVGNYDNIKLKSGANTITLTGNATSLTVDKYSRWI